MKISVITPTVRPEGLSLVEKALREQTFRDFEWIIVSPKVYEILNDPHFSEVLGCDKYEFGPEFRGKSYSILGKYEDKDAPFIAVIPEPEKEEGDVWSLNKAYNTAIKEAKGELIISWQDWTYAKPDTLEMFWQHFKDEPKTLVSAVGNKYETDSWDIMIWKDPRIRDDMPSFYPCYPNDIEWNLCSVPKQALHDVGGFDEGLDKWFGMDGFSVNMRIWDLGGYDFKLDQSIKSYSLPHGRVDDWEEKNAIHGPYEQRKEELKKKGKWPNVGYLEGV